MPTRCRGGTGRPDVLESGALGKDALPLLSVFSREAGAREGGTSCTICITDDGKMPK